MHVATGNGMAARNWRLLAAIDQHVDYCLVRDSDTRLSERGTAGVRDWLPVAEKNGSQSAIIHCIRGHPKHTEQAIVDGLWGGRPRVLHQLLRQNITQMMDSITSNTSPTVKSTDDTMRTLLNQLLWPVVSNFSYYHVTDGRHRHLDDHFLYHVKVKNASDRSSTLTSTCSVNMATS